MGEPMWSTIGEESITLKSVLESRDYRILSASIFSIKLLLGLAELPGKSGGAILKESFGAFLTETLEATE